MAASGHEGDPNLSKDPMKSASLRPLMTLGLVLPAMNVHMHALRSQSDRQREYLTYCHLYPVQEVSPAMAE